MMKRLAFLVVAVGILAGLHARTYAGDTPIFKNGPYLLAPKTDSMVLVWETTGKTNATIRYGTNRNALGTPVPVIADENAPDFQGEKMNLFRVKLGPLQPGTEYFYEVALDNGEICKSKFRTLAENPDMVRIISVSDSHVFATRNELNAAVKNYNPDLILHCGDIVEGTGAQAEQFSFWFTPDGDDDFIHTYPVVYASGNHDQGGIYFDTYVYDVQDAEFGGEVNGNSSFNYGNLHILSINSNPWGLFQMNSEATGNQADAATLDTINKTIEWIRDDLQRDPARNAEFRLVFMHHPKSDAYTNRYIPAVIEPGNVDLMLSGHTHTYARTVSDNPAVGAGTVYMTHQDARTYNKKGDFFLITSVPGEGVLKVEALGAEGAGKETKLAAATTIASKKQQLEYSDIAIAPDSVLYNGDVTVSAKVTNTGKGIAAAAIPVYDNGVVRYLYKFDGGVKILEPGASATLSGTLKMESLGEHTLSLADATKLVAVNFRPATFDYTNVRVKLGDGQTSDITSNKLFVKADVKNIGNTPGLADAEFSINGKPVSSQQYQLDSDETKTTEFSYTFDKAGEYLVTVGNAPAQTIFIEGSIQGMPLVRDKSGHGNHAYIHGEPKLGVDDKGRRTLVLDGRRDYIEIPDNGGYTVTDGVTGMVWANLPSEGTTKGGVTELVEPYADLDGKGAIPDHNPLMLKGIGLGWGTPYLFRIAVRETGKVTYGVCLHDDNGEFSWNDGSQPEAGIKKDTWVQYTSSFDFANGADAYQNGYQSAHVDKPAFTAPVKNWEGTPMYIGLGFKNTLLTGRNRGMYHTMLPGAISQVRFYTAKVPAEENDHVRNNPATAGVSVNALKIWLDFEAENIDTAGTHTTEWIPIPDGAGATSLSYHASFSGDASITAVIQTSDDTHAITQEKTIPLVSGGQSVALTGLMPAKYARIKTRFVSDLNDSESSVPVLHEYLLAGGVNKRWNTLVDWNKGTFEGACGHQSGDVYRNHAKDFDKFGSESNRPEGAAVPSPQGDMRIAFLPDIHFHDVYANLGDDAFDGVVNPKNGKKAFIRTMYAQLTSTRLFNENYFIFTAALDDMAARGIKHVVLPGDFTDDGQPVHTIAVKSILDDYAKKHGMTFFLANGNHDPYRPYGRPSGKANFMGVDGSNQKVYSRGMKECRNYEGGSAKIDTGEGLPTACTEVIRELGYAEILGIMAGHGFMPRPDYKYWETPYSSYTQDSYDYETARLESRLENRMYEICREGAGGKHKQPEYTDCAPVPDASYLVELDNDVWLMVADANIYEISKDAKNHYTTAPDLFEGSSYAGYNSMAQFKPQVLEWMESVAQRAKANGKRLIAVSHFPMTEYYGGIGQDIIDVFGMGRLQTGRLPSEETMKMLADLGVRVHVGGHMHVNSTNSVRSGDNFLVNIQPPSPSSYVSAYKILTLDGADRIEVETVRLDDVANFDELFDLYRMEHNYLVDSNSKQLWDDRILESKSFREYSEKYFRELTRHRFVPREWPTDLRSFLLNAKASDLLVMSRLPADVTFATFVNAPGNPLAKAAEGMAGSLPEDAREAGAQDGFSDRWSVARADAERFVESAGMRLSDFDWDGFELMVDFHRIINAGELALPDIPVERMRQYEVLAKALAVPAGHEVQLEPSGKKIPAGLGAGLWARSRCGALVNIMLKRLGADPSVHFVIDYGKKSITKR